MADGDALFFVGEIASAVEQAAAGQKVLVIRLSVGKGLPFTNEKLASELYKRFPGASVEIKGSKQEGAVVVKDIEVE